jgi:hypothetical protein
MAHSFDSLIKVETGVDIRPLLKVANYDQEVVHGKSNVFDYIRWKENTEIFKKITPHLVDAYNVRAKRYFTKRAGLLAQIVALKRLILMRLNRKNGIPR